MLPPLAGRRPAMAARLAGSLAIVAAEVVTGALATWSAMPGAILAVFWPNTGLSAIALLLVAPRQRWLVLAAVFPANLAANLLSGRDLDLALVLALGNVVAAGLFLAWMTWGRRTPRLHTLTDLVRLLVATALGATGAAVVVGAGAALTGDADLLVAARGALTDHAASLLVLVPLTLDVPHRPRPSAVGRAEAAAAWASLAVVTTLAFAPGQELPIAFLPFPVLAWAAGRLEVRQVTWQIVLLAALVVALTTAGAGTFGATVERVDQPEVAGTLVTAYLVSAILVALPLALHRAQRLIALDRLTSNYGMLSNLLAATTGNAILGTTLEGRIEFFNVGAERMLGWRAEEVTGSGSIALDRLPGGEARLRVAVDERPAMGSFGALAEPLLDRAEADVSGDWSFVRRDGTVRTASVAVTRRFGEDGRPVGYLAVADDVTERRREEAAVAAALATEKQIVDRLAQVDQTKNDFLATASHELRTPITSIIGYAELLLADDTGALPAMHHQIVGRIRRNGRRLLGLIEDMLAMGQVEVGSFHFDRRPIDLRRPVAQAVAEASVDLEAKRLTVELALGEDPVIVEGDEEKLERVFAHLLNNAVKFSHESDTVVVTVAREHDEAIATVADTGLGIPREDQDHLFDRFYRGANAHELAIQGVGLGLSIASSIVVGHGGSIEVHSEPGRGSTFAVRMPASTCPRGSGTSG